MEGRPPGEAHGKAYLAVAGKLMGEKARRQPSARAQRPVDGHKESPEASKSHTNQSKLEQGLGKALLCHGLLPHHREPRNKGAILSRIGCRHLRLAVPGGGGIRGCQSIIPPNS